MSFQVWREIASAYNGKIIKEWERRNVRYWHLADMLIAALGAKRTWLRHRKMSANDPKRTFEPNNWAQFNATGRFLCSAGES